MAAPQIGVSKQIFVIDLGEGPSVFINPKILNPKGEEEIEEGCLSFPGLFADTVRPHYLRVTGLDETGKTFDRVYETFDAVVVHHEIDHLDGVLFIDRLEKLEDLYHIREDEFGKHVRVPVSVNIND